MASYAAAGFRRVEIACVAVDVKLHVASMKLEDCIGVCGAVVKKLVDILVGTNGCVGLGAGDVAEGDIESGIDGACVVQKGPDNFLYAFDLRRGQFVSCVKRFRCLLCGAKDRCIVAMRCVLGSVGVGMIKFLQGGGDVAWHRKFAGSVVVIPFEMNSSKEGG